MSTRIYTLEAKASAEQPDKAAMVIGLETGFVVSSFSLISWLQMFYSGSEAMPGSCQGAKEKMKEKRKICVCFIVFGGLSLTVLYGYFTRGV